MLILVHSQCLVAADRGYRAQLFNDIQSRKLASAMESALSEISQEAAMATQTELTKQVSMAASTSNSEVVQEESAVETVQDNGSQEVTAVPPRQFPKIVVPPYEEFTFDIALSTGYR